MIELIEFYIVTLPKTKNLQILSLAHFWLHQVDFLPDRIRNKMIENQKLRTDSNKESVFF